MSKLLRGYKRPVCLAIGNWEVVPDSRGLYLAQRLQELGFKVVEAGLYPENYLEKVVGLDPDLIVLTDAIRSDRDFILTTSPSRDCSITTHSLPISTLIDYLRLRTHAPVLFFGVNRHLRDGDIDEILARVTG
ncbi:hypothetical protein DRP53_00260 [candidate division WOR-3 bacterium]|uniref:Uncharacterized protein n=1 Tax=candidate division WOR-3 bacterium TaxID=2052148 RepID=A0A660SPG1_UNCW3|nr:MAG: hypothetical protein DRP53_00260 [candidate division WOR-3 bacterium]